MCDYPHNTECSILTVDSAEMSSTAYSTLLTVSETMFPGIGVSSGLARPANTMEAAALKLGNQLVSSLPLQLTLYLNVIYFPCWLAVILTVVSVKADM